MGGADDTRLSRVTAKKAALNRPVSPSVIGEWSAGGEASAGGSRVRASASNRAARAAISSLSARASAAVVVVASATWAVERRSRSARPRANSPATSAAMPAKATSQA
ncbi:hypothetical protein BH24ACT4_BH24ACT4_08790 [soil metagenome]